MAIAEVATIAVSGAAGSAGSLAFTSTDTTGATAALLFIVHEGASTTYTWSDNKSTPGANFVSLATMNASAGAGAGDLSMNAVFVHGMTGGTGHIFTVTFGASRTQRFGGAQCLSGTFSSTFLAATTQTAEFSASETTIDAGSLVTDAAAYLIQFGCNYNGTAMSAAGTGWTIKSNATGGRHFQVRNEASSGTFDPTYDVAGEILTALTIAAAIKETAGGGAYNAVPVLTYYQRMRRGIIY